jgi:hypothetical protein
VKEGVGGKHGRKWQPVAAMPHATHSVCSVCTNQSGTQQLAAGLAVGDGCSKGQASSRPHTCAGAPSLMGCTSFGAILGIS